MAELLRIAGLDVRLPAPGGTVRRLVHAVDLQVDEGEAVALTGPSGAGKSLVARAVCGLLPARTVAGVVTWRGRSFAAGDQRAWSRVRGRGLTLVLQEPGAGLHPVRRVGEVIAETVLRHRGGTRADARRAARDLLAEVRVADPERCARARPHELSGGQQQRALLAAALACAPRLLVADEPTTSLDPTVQASILHLLDDLRRRRGMALLLISHDPHLLSLVTERAVALEAGRVVAWPPVAPPPDPAPPAAARGAPVLDARGIVARWPGAADDAVRGVDLALAPGRVVGLAGESGCGKTTLARVLAGHLAPRDGRVEIGGRDLHAARGAGFRRLRRDVQLLFQHAGASLDPRQRAVDALAEAGAGSDAARALLAEVDLPADTLRRRPHQLSGGQRQRLGLARALAVRPRVLIADEPTVGLDDAAARRVRALLAGAARRRDLALLIIAHDLPLLTAAADRIVVMLDGVVVESYAPADAPPRHPYTRRLHAVATPSLAALGDRWRTVASQLRARTAATGPACPYHAVCGLVKPKCRTGLPELRDVGGGHLVRCPEVQTPPQSQFIDTY